MFQLVAMAVYMYGWIAPPSHVTLNDIISITLLATVIDIAVAAIRKK